MDSRSPCPEERFVKQIDLPPLNEGDLENGLSLLTPGNIIDTQTIELVENIAAFFEAEKQNGGPILLTALESRTKAATGLTGRTINHIVKHQNIKLKRKIHRPKPNGRCRPYDKDLVHPIIERVVKENPSTTLKTVQEILRNETKINFSIVSLSRIMHKLGFDFSETKSSNIIDDDMEDSRLYYADILQRYRNLNRPIFYQDRWIGAEKLILSDDNESDSDSEQSATDPRRFVVLHAASTDGFVKDACYIYPVTRENDTDQHAREQFEQWFEFVLLPKLPKNAVVVLNNVFNSDNEQNPESLTAKSHRKDIINWLDDRNIPFDPSMSKELLFEIYVRPNLKDSLSSIQELSASKKGIKIVRTPPNASYLNPFRFIWKRIKRLVSMRSLTMDLNDLAVFVEQELSRVTAKDWKDAISRSERLENA